MRSAAHSEALIEIFSGNANIVTQSIALSAKIDITSEILADYQKYLSSNTYFQTWFAASQGMNRIVTNSLLDAPSKIRKLPADIAHYAAASYFSGGLLLKSHNAPKAGKIQDLESIGSILIDVTEAPPEKTPGENPIESINLAKNGIIEPNILERFFKAEEKVVVYDKYIKQESMELLEHIAKTMEPGGDFKVFTTCLDKKCLSPTSIKSKLNTANPQLTVSCEEVSVAFRKSAHDRYIFAGDRLHIVFTRGLDCFGKKNKNGIRANHLSDINIHTTNRGNILEIETVGGTRCSVFLR